MSAEDVFGTAEDHVFNGTVKMLERDGESLLGKTVGFLRSLLRDKVVEGKEAEAIKKLSLPTTSKAAVAFEEKNEADSSRGSFHRAKGRGTGLHEQGRDSNQGIRQDFCIRQGR
ncbi:hypothetical protein B484DRAFT_406366 [Ochromonadaceae sp. CCMP2298]|nr:hypothetical protein B484DRAFT_406366 [Ochromonadaceae sp. CCMP2298]